MEATSDLHAANCSILRGGQAPIRPPLHAANYSVLRGGQASIRPPLHAANYSVLRGGQAPIRPPLHAANYSVLRGGGHLICMQPITGVARLQSACSQLQHPEGWPGSNQATSACSQLQHPARLREASIKPPLHAATVSAMRSGQTPIRLPMGGGQVPIRPPTVCILKGGQFPIRSPLACVQSNSPNQHVANSSGQRFQTTVWPKGWTILKFGTPLYSNQSTVWVMRGGHTDNLHMEH